MWNSTAIQCFNDEAQAILDLIPQLDADFDKAINLILECKGKILITGVGKSGHIRTAAPCAVAARAQHTHNRNER